MALRPRPPGTVQPPTPRTRRENHPRKHRPLLQTPSPDQAPFRMANTDRPPPVRPGIHQPHRTPLPQTRPAGRRTRPLGQHRRHRRRRTTRRHRQPTQHPHPPPRRRPRPDQPHRGPTRHHPDPTPPQHNHRNRLPPRNHLGKQPIQRPPTVLIAGTENLSDPYDAGPRPTENEKHR